MIVYDLIGHARQPSIKRQHHEQSHEIMCNVCCKELKGWCKSFTRTERLLSILEAILLVLLLGFTVFLILHLLACRNKQQEDVTVTTPGHHPQPWPTTPRPVPTTSAKDINKETLSPDIECTWEPSKPTKAETRYYLQDRHTRSEAHSSTTAYKLTTEIPQEAFGEATQEYDDDDDFLEVSDEEFAEDTYKSHVVALVKLKPPGDATFGCILTKITRFWTVTAASCIESIEEVDSLDSFVIVEQFGSEQASRPRTVADVRLHPQYQGRNRSYDLAALRSDRALRPPREPLRLPGLLDYLLLAVGERLHILGYGGYRTVGSGSGRQLRQVSVHAVSAAQCEQGGDTWAPRHLWRGAALRHGSCGAAALCCGARAARRLPCNYCAGTPLLRGGALLGVMSDNGACGVACEPQLYVNIATLRDWIDSVIDT